MKTVNLLKAIELAKENHSTKLTINHIRSGDTSVSSAIPIVIHECVPAVIDKLKDAGFSLSMGVEGLHVTDIFIK